ncbi:hypothetical protein N7495_009921 [Penicillium taxi]|uniref:uncharacterized protein n=1 Tax=Penicillium taxi TaxID=168475 RepID=UPI002545AC3D|nr:uncharacterized protein N7495_009921 [Penicillium taxi]KAJ5885411.1 hypothetical protein N7495_009921 [Penicillium taxi]
MTVAALSPEQIQLIKATIPVLAEHGYTITSIFYKNMIAAHPDLNNIFNIPNQENGHQPRALAGSLYAYASYIDDLAALSAAVELICSKHASLYVRPEHYDIVGKYLIEAMGLVLGDALTPEIRDAWGAAYWQLANIMITREQQLYEQSEGWTDWRDFKIADKVRESDEITSFYLAPADGMPLPSFRPGQYISVLVYVPEVNYDQPRQYSLSDKPSPDYYRISVKKERGIEGGAPAHPGYVSNLLHDNYSKGDPIRVSHPAGDFFLSDKPSNPVVLISAGVGITSLTSILNTLTSDRANNGRPLHFIHGARTSAVRAFKSHISTLTQEHPSLRTTFFASQPAAEEVQGVDYQIVGHVDLAKLDANSDLFLSDENTEYYICGPTKFMTETKSSLGALGVSADRIKMELFGTGGVPE